MLHVKSGGTVTLHTEALHDGDPANLLDSTDGMSLDVLVWRWSGAALEFLDWNDNTFKALGSVTTLRQTLAFIDDTEVPGVAYRAWTVPTGDYTCGFVIRDTAAVAKNVPQQGAVAVGQWMDQVDAVDTRLPPDPADESLQQASHTQTQADIATRAAPGDAMDLVADAVDASAVAASGAQEIRDEILDDATRFSGADIDAAISTRATQADILSDATPFLGASIDVAISSRAVPGDQMALTAAAVLALVDDVWDEDVVAAHGGADASGFLLRALGAALSQRTNNPNLNALLGVADAAGVDLPEQINTELATTQGHGAGAWTTATGFAVPGDAMGLVADAVDASAVATSGAQEIRDEILADGIPFNGAYIDAAISSRAAPGDAMTLTGAQVVALVDDVWDEDIVVAHGGADTSGLLLRALGALISQRTNTQTLHGLLGVADAVGVDLPEQINTELEVTQGHGAGLWTGTTPASVATAVWSALLPGAFGAGSAGFILGTNLDALVTSRATQADILSDATPFVGANVDAAITSRSSHTAADVWTVVTRTLTGIGASGISSQASLDALADAVIAADLTAIAGSTSTEVRTGATQANGFYDDLVLMVTNSAGVVARRITGYLLVNGAFTVPALPFTPIIGDRVIVLGRLASSAIDLDAIADAVWDEDIVATHGTGDTAGLLVRALGALISQRSNNSTLSALLGVTDAVGVDLPEQINTELEVTQGHGAGSWQAGGGLTQQQIRDAMKLAPTGGAPAAGSVDSHLDDIETDTNTIDGRLPADPADESNQLAQHAATQAAIGLLNDLSIANVQTALTNQGYTSARATALDNLDATISSIAALIGGLNDLNQGDVQSAMTAQGYTVVRAALLDNLTDLDDSITNVLAAIAALNNLSQADVQSAMTAQGYTTARGALLSNLDASVSSVLTAISSLNDLDIADVQTALDNQGLTSVRAALLDNLDATISSIAVLIGGLNDLDTTQVENAVWDSLSVAHNLANTMGALLNAAGAGAGTTDWTAAERAQMRFRLAMDGSQVNPTTGVGTLEELLADTDAIDTRLPADPADELLQQAAHTQTQADVAAIQADTDDIQTRLPAALVGGRMDSDVGNMQTDTLDANALAADAVAEIQAGLALELGEVLGLLHKNAYIDQTSYDTEGQIIGARVRTFADRAAALAATEGGVGEGELATYTVVTTWEAPGRMESYRLVREP